MHMHVSLCKSASYMVSKWIGTYIFEQVCVYDGYKSCHDKNNSPLPLKWTLGTIFHAVGSIWTHWNLISGI